MKTKNYSLINGLRLLVTKDTISLQEIMEVSERSCENSFNTLNYLIQNKLVKEKGDGIFYKVCHIKDITKLRNKNGDFELNFSAKDLEQKSKIINEDNCEVLFSILEEQGMTLDEIIEKLETDLNECLPILEVCIKEELLVLYDKIYYCTMSKEMFKEMLIYMECNRKKEKERKEKQYREQEKQQKKYKKNTEIPLGTTSITQQNEDKIVDIKDKSADNEQDKGLKELYDEDVLAIRIQLSDLVIYTLFAIYYKFIKAENTSARIHIRSDEVNELIRKYGPIDMKYTNDIENLLKKLEMVGLITFEGIGFCLNVTLNSIKRILVMALGYDIVDAI